MRQSTRVVIYGSVMAAAVAVAMPSYAELTKADRLGSAMLVEIPAAPSASAGAGATVPAEPVYLIDRSVPDRTVVISQGTGPQWLNVDWGDTVQFLVRQPGAPDRTMKWHFNGLDNVISYADIDPSAQFARNVRIYVNQSTSLLHEKSGD